MKEQKFMPEGWQTEYAAPITEQVLNQAFETGKIMQGFVTKCDSNYNLYVDLGGNKKGMIPREEIEAINLDEAGFPKPNICINKVNKVVQFKVKDMQTQDYIILSRKEVGQEAIKWLQNDLQEGMIVHGMVRNIQPYGVFVEIGGGIVGLLHIEDISVVRIKSPKERFKIGQKIDVMIKYIDRKENRCLLTHKELLGTWEENIKEFSEGDVVTGIVREIEKSKNGIFIELKPNLVGLADYKENLEYGQKARVYVKRIIPNKKKIKLVLI